MRYINVFFFLISLYSYSQTGHIISFEQKMKISKEEALNLPSNVLKSLEVELEWKEANMYIQGNESVYIVGGSSEVISNKIDNGVKKNKIIVKPEKLYFKNFKAKKLHTQIKTSLDVILIDEPLFLNNWVLVDETRIIDDIVCYKAISKTNNEGLITAWYSDEIAIQNGPAQYGGLPGLIMYLEHEYMVYRIKSMQLNTLEKNNFPRRDKSLKVISRNEYLKKYVHANNQGKLLKSEVKGKRTIEIYGGKTINIGKEKQ